MNLRRTLAAGVLACMLTVAPARAVSLTVAGETLTPSVQTLLIQDTAYVPLRAVAQRLDNDARISWRSGTATVTSDVLSLTARVGERWLEANGRCFYAEHGVRLIDGSVMVPARALAAAMGGSVAWDGAARAVHIRAGGGSPGAAPYSADELYWLSRIISAESKGEPLEGKLAVGTVVLNRVASREFPNTIYGVIFDDRWGVQFTPVSNGAIYDAPTAESVAAAKLCLEGVREAGESLYFLDPSQSSNHWAQSNRTYVTTIGRHWFYA